MPGTPIVVLEQPAAPAKLFVSDMATLGRLALICFPFVLFGSSSIAQSAIPPAAIPQSDWAGLVESRTISAGAEMEARTTDNKRYRGRFKAAEDDALVVVTASGERRFARATVSRVSVKKPGHRLRHTLIGLGIGAAAGIALGAAADARCTGDCIEGKTPLGKEAGTGIGALIGTIIGVALPGGGWREVYRAP
jgi:hypothetical protein